MEERDFFNETAEQRTQAYWNEGGQKAKPDGVVRM